MGGGGGDSARGRLPAHRRHVVLISLRLLPARPRPGAGWGGEVLDRVQTGLHREATGRAPSRRWCAASSSVLTRTKAVAVWVAGCAAGVATTGHQRGIGSGPTTLVVLATWRCDLRVARHHRCRNFYYHEDEENSSSSNSSSSSSNSSSSSRRRLHRRRGGARWCLQLLAARSITVIIIIILLLPVAADEEKEPLFW